jgi:hypothetical protein
LLGLLGNKHIPEIYLRSGELQRRELLAGLLDTDGTCDRAKPIIELCNTNPRLARDAYELISSLGFDPSLRTGRAMLKGRDCGPKYRVCFTAREQVFNLPRKLRRQAPHCDWTRRSERTIIGIEPAGTVPVRCITVDSYDSSYLITRDHIVTHNSQQLAIGRTLWEIGRYPGIRICIVSNTDKQAQKICMGIAKYILGSPEYRKVFPHVQKDESSPWTMHELSVIRDVAAKDPTVRTCGVHGNILGARIDLLIIDDILDWENTRTQTGRDDLYNWFHATLETRLTRQARILCIGTAWHRDDLMHRFAARPDWLAVRYPVYDEETMELSWSDRWSMDRIEEKRDILGTVEFNRALLCVARSDEESRFKKAWIDSCLERGEGRSLTYGLELVPEGYRTYTGVDIGVREQQGSDLTSLFTIIVHPDETREVLDIQAGRWDGPSIVDRIIDTHCRYQSIVIVENVAAQDFIIQFARKKSAVPIVPFTTTGKKKHHPQFGLESMATEMASQKWIIPSHRGRCHSQVRAWIDEMLYYDPNGHPGDRLMSSWFAREGSRLTRPKAKIRRLDLLSR